MNYALIFAGGVGQRMNTVSLPKQFLKVHGKEIIVHTIEHFQNCNEIDGIVVVCVSSFIDFMKSLKEKYKLTKILDIVSGGATGQLSIYNGLTALSKISKSNQDIVLIHDGVRPLIDEATIKKNIESVKQFGSAITVAKSIETILTLNSNEDVDRVIDRQNCFLGRAPQSFYFKDIFKAHEKAVTENKIDFIDSVTMMQSYGYKLHTVEGPVYNIKVTTPNDFYMFKAILDSKEYEQIKVID